MPVADSPRVVDARGLSHTGAIAMTARIADDVAGGTLFELRSTDAGAVDEVALWCRSTGDQLVRQTSDGTVYHFVLRRRRPWMGDPTEERR